MSEKHDLSLKNRNDRESIVNDYECRLDSNINALNLNATKIKTKCDDDIYEQMLQHVKRRLQE